MSASTGRPLQVHLADFTAYELPSEKWMKVVDPKVRLRVRGKRRNFVSPVVKVDNQRADAETDTPCTHWPWNDDERCSRPTFVNTEVFEVEVERRFLLWYKCIRRTKQVTIDQIRTSDHPSCTLSLYDGQYSTRELEDKVEIGKITFTLNETGEASSEEKLVQ